jgi:hypothetical protein
VNDLAPASPARTARAKWPLLAALGVLGLVGIVLAWLYWPGRGTDGPPEAGPVPAEDPRLSYDGLFRNVRPDVKYVGDQACGDCHPRQAIGYSMHPMGQALAPIAEATPIEKYGPAAHDPFIARGLHYGVRRKDGHVFHREAVIDPKGKVLAEIESEVLFAVGSGTRARSYLVNHDGYLFQSPLTWFPEEKRWDLSPGYENRNHHFGRTIAPGCLFCHCNQVEHVPFTVNRYRPPIFDGHVIGCERCHGPGELHVRLREARGRDVKGPDYTIVNPARLDPPLREAVCQQCHVQGEQRVVARGRGDFDYRPGLPLHLFLMDFVDQRNKRADVKFVSSVEQLMISRCYRATSGKNKLGCISCHDPHYHPPPEKKVAHYRKRCLNCHTDQSCGLPRAVRLEKEKEDSCIACHMPKTGSEVDHTAITDHRIPRHADAKALPPEHEPPGPEDLVPFQADRLDPGDEEVKRNLGIALMGMLSLAPPEDVKRRFCLKALPLLERAVERDRTDLPAWEAKGTALWTLKRREEARAAFEEVLAQRPDAETTLFAVGKLALDMKRLEEARAYFERAVRINPWRWQYRLGLAQASFRLREWDRAADECREALRLEPANSASRSLLIQCDLATGRWDQAEEEFKVLWEVTSKGRRPALQRWYETVRRNVGPGPGPAGFP